MGNESEFMNIYKSKKDNSNPDLPSVSVLDQLGVSSSFAIADPRIVWELLPNNNNTNYFM